MGILAAEKNTDVPRFLAKEFVCIHIHNDGKDRPRSFSTYPRERILVVVLLGVALLPLSRLLSPALLLSLLLIHDPSFSNFAES